MSDIYSHQRKNRTTTVLLMAGFLIFVPLVGVSVDVYTAGSLGAVTRPVAALIAAGFTVLYTFLTVTGGRALIISSTGAERPSHDNPLHRKLHNVVTEMALASGLPMPKVYVIPDPAPNAFAAGWSPESSMVAATQGLLEMMTREELQAVVAHEMAHVRNFDTRTMTVVSVLLGTVTLLTDWAMRTWRLGGVKARGRRSLHPVALLVIALFVLLSPFVSRLMAMAVSRTREFQADATAAELTRNPLALADALEKIGESESPVGSAHKGTAHLFISDPLKRRSDNGEGVFSNLFSTHPPLERRVEKLRKMGYAWARYREDFQPPRAVDEKAPAGPGREAV